MNPALEKLLQLKKACYVLDKSVTRINNSQDMRRTLVRISEEHKKGSTELEHPTVFHTVLQSDLPPQEKTKDRLGDEAQLVIGAGVTTTSWALDNAIFHILSNPQITSKLQDELRQAIPHPNADRAFEYQKLEKLPYLGACVKEAIRVSLGVTARNHRLIKEPIQFGDYVIPPYTPVSMTTADVHHDEKIYKDAKKFVPERWMGDSPKALNGESLEKYFVAFGKGPRSCLGIKYVVEGIA
jgi:cytochrome P450